MNLPEYSQVDVAAKMAVLRFGPNGYNEYIKALMATCGQAFRVEAVSMKTQPRTVYEVLIGLTDDQAFKQGMSTIRA